jgi:hypothetical protein
MSINNKILSLIIPLISSVSFFANADGLNLKPYMEGSVGWFKSNDVKVENILYDQGPVTGSDITTSFASTGNYGVEFGLKDFLVSGLRVGISETYVSQGGKTSGTITSDISGTNVTRSENEKNPSTSTNYAMFNTYYDFYNKITPITPYLGIGVGAANNSALTNSVFAGTLMAGANYTVYQNLYVGLKSVFYYVDQSTVNDESCAIGCNTLSTHAAFAVNGVVGYQF